MTSTSSMVPSPDGTLYSLNVAPWGSAPTAAGLTNPETHRANTATTAALKRAGMRRDIFHSDHRGLSPDRFDAALCRTCLGAAPGRGGFSQPVVLINA